MDKAMLEALKKRKMNGAPALTITLGMPEEEKMDSHSDLAPEVEKEDAEADMKLASLLKEEKAQGGMDNDTPEDQEVHSLIKDISEQDKMDLMNRKPRSLMERARQAQLMNKKA